ncbi:EamA family transporter RarD [Sphingomonas daechungensis]|uniref:EamA family transporter RarD n=1 Tax=Sphingomonas daechungensis TaxID=1176646 RepID=UPI0037834D0F
MNRPDTHGHARQGFLLGAAAYGLWGVLPIYFKALRAIDSVDIVAHRIVWSIPVLAGLLSFTNGWSEVREALRNRRAVIMLTITALLIGVNWLLYVYAVNSGHILAGSLGYYLNPLANVLLGRVILKERLHWLQWAAVALAAAGISALAIGALGQLWISLTLCVSFATYGLLRKIAPVDAVAGLAIETGILFPLAAVWLIWDLAAGNAIFGNSTMDIVLIAGAGLVTAIPLLLFTAAAKRLRYSTLGMLQFLAPTLQFLLAVLIYGEPFTTAHAIAFGSIWTALALYVIALVRHARASVTLPE